MCYRFLFDLSNHKRAFMIMKYLLCFVFLMVTSLKLAMSYFTHETVLRPEAIEWNPERCRE